MLVGIQLDPGGGGGGGGGGGVIIMAMIHQVI